MREELEGCSAAWRPQRLAKVVNYSTRGAQGTGPAINIPLLSDMCALRITQAITHLVVNFVHAGHCDRNGQAKGDRLV